MQKAIKIYLLKYFSMKKVTLLLAATTVLLLSWCWGSILENQEENDHYLSYENELTVEGVTPLNQYWGALKDGFLVLRETFDDYTDIVFFEPGLWENYFENENEYLPWNKIFFKWGVEWVDWAAGSHYYQWELIKELKTVWYPNEEEVRGLIDSYNSCEIDEECVDFYPWCPLGCSNPVNQLYLETVTSIAQSFRDREGEQCVYRCLAPSQISCENYKCVAKFDIIEENSEEGLTANEIAEANSLFN